MDSVNGPIFFWRGALNRDAWESVCPWCGAACRLLRGPGDYDDNVQRRCECPLCGWHASRHLFFIKRTGLFSGTYQMGLLRSFDRDMLKRALKEVRAHLRSLFSAPHSIDWHEMGFD